MVSSEKFLIKAKKKYDNKYDYSLVEYKNSETKVKIKCNQHNIIFEQAPAAHIRGQEGCKVCAGRIYSTETFISKAKEIHGDKYEYSISEYVGSEYKVKIICPEHGEFEQLPIAHSKGQGCPECGLISRSDKRRLNTETFIEKIKEIHGDRYDYSLVNYVDNKTKIKIICKEHGEFEQSPDKHSAGQGCIKCGKDNCKKLLQKSNDSFIDSAISIHGNKYDYSLVNYINARNRVTIICPEHGEFEQLPNDHLSNHGCIKCSSSVSKDETSINLELV